MPAAAATMEHAPKHTAAYWRDFGERWKHKWQRFEIEKKEAIEALGRRALTESVGAGVGLLSGVARGLWGDPKTGDVLIEGVDVHIAATVLTSGLALTGLAGEASDGLAVAGACMLAITLDHEVPKFVREAMK